MVTIEVKRNRQSVTQGSATVFVNGVSVITFGDEMYLKAADGTFTHGNRTVNAKHHGEVIGGWGSIKPDHDFIIAALYHPLDNHYHCSDIVKKIISAG